MKTKHCLVCASSAALPQIEDESVDLVVTSPPYPMIKMWDSVFREQNPEIEQALLKVKGWEAFSLMHRELDKTWVELARVLKPGAVACINIGDAVRNLGGHFQLYPNHSHIIEAFAKLKFQALPLILWHKKTNAPNKFMGSGMLPAAAYVTLEHEYILLFRKEGKRRAFKTKEKNEIRRRSAFFWEERNKWFSDIWFDLPGISQTEVPQTGISQTGISQTGISQTGISQTGISQTEVSQTENQTLRSQQNTNGLSLRKRSAAFPLELASRLICMYSIQSDLVLDPFAGTGTVACAALSLGRNSWSVEIAPSFQPIILNHLLNSTEDLNSRIRQRLLDHVRFIKERGKKFNERFARTSKEEVKGGIKGRFKEKPFQHENSHYGFPVMTGQEVSIQFPYIKSVRQKTNALVSAKHSFSPPYTLSKSHPLLAKSIASNQKKPPQLKLFGH